MLETDYPNDEFIHLEWHTSGHFANGEGSARAGSYGVSGVPDVFFDGQNNVTGAGDSLSAYNQYKPRLDAALAVGAKCTVDAIVDFNGDTLRGDITVDVEIAPGETIGTPEVVSIRAAVVEDGIFACCEPQTQNGNWNAIARTMIFEVPLTISNSGETQQVVRNDFVLDGDWNHKNLYALAWVQRNTNKKVLQAAKALVSYGVEVEDLDAPVAKVQGTPAEFDTKVTYTGGLTSDVTVTLDKSSLPPGWDAEVIWNAITDPNGITIPNMTQGQIEMVTIRTIPGARPALGSVTVTTEVVNNTSMDSVHEYSTFSNTPAILLVDDDRGSEAQLLYEAAILGSGYYSVIHNTGPLGVPDFTTLDFYDAVVWNTGEFQSQTIGANGRNALMAYLDNGTTLETNNFFLTSHGLLNQFGLVTLVTDYLRVSSFTQDAQAPSATGVPGDPIGDGMSLTLNPPFLDLADAITPNTGGIVWLNGANGDIGMRYDAGNFKTVFLSAAYEGVSETDPDPNNQLRMMGRVPNWFFAGAVDAPQVGAATEALALWQNAPNPFRGATSFRFALPHDAVARVAIYNVAGQRVADLVNQRFGAGEHTVTWDGVDSNGSHVASGVYLYRLEAAGESLTKEMVLMK
jgi:hypothetical protein